MARNLPDSLITLLAEADKRKGFPAGTMLSVMQQESGGNAKYLDDPTAYHYGLNAQGKRVAGHTGKVSTAFGPFGILESTGSDPGYGVQPLQGKDINEQVRFASDYLAARSKQGGGLQAGLAGYGEGQKYANQVMARTGNPAPVEQQVSPVQLAQAPTPTTVAYRDVAPSNGPIPMGYVAPDPEGWGQFKQAMPEQIQASSLDFGNRVQQPGYVSMEMPKVDFRAFSRFKGRA